MKTSVYVSLIVCTGPFLIHYLSIFPNFFIFERRHFVVSENAMNWTQGYKQHNSNFSNLHQKEAKTKERTNLGLLDIREGVNRQKQSWPTPEKLKMAGMFGCLVSGRLVS